MLNTYMNRLRQLTKDKLLDIIRNQEQIILAREMQIRSRESEIEQLEQKVKTLKTNKKK